jgi:glucose-6-phosphate isomerase
MKNTKKSKEVTKDIKININDLPFAKLSFQDISQYDILEQYTQSNVVIVGMGGSWLGAEVLSALATSDRRVFFMHSLSPIDIAAIFQFVNPLDTLFVIQGKSGKTAETNIIYAYCKSYLQKHGAALGPNLIFCSEDGSPLHKEAIDNKALFFSIPKDIGGRYSVFSCMGLVTAKLMGVDIEELLEGSSQNILNTDLIVDTLIDNKVKQIILFNYNKDYSSINRWFAQLVAESLGKDGKELTPITAHGVEDQHSLLQMFEDGDPNKLFFFIPPAIGDIEALDEMNINIDYPIDIEELYAASYLGTITSLSDKYPVISFAPENHSSYDAYLGYMLNLFMTITAKYGIRTGINPFDQPGVESSKIITQKYLNQ